MAELGCLVCVHAAAILFRGSFFRKLGRDESNERLSQRALHNIMYTCASGCVHTKLNYLYSQLLHSKGHGCTK